MEVIFPVSLEMLKLILLARGGFVLYYFSYEEEVPLNLAAVYNLATPTLGYTFPCGIFKEEGFR